MDYMKNYKKWMNNNLLDKHTKDELLEIANNESEIKERFIRNLEFGTGGLRGIMGAGTNRINIYTIRKVTQGLANYIKKSSSENQDTSVAIAYDSRHCSDLFAKAAALVFAANNIKAYLFDYLSPTPELSFTVRHLRCDAGIVITASHNPSEYNGYKVYGADGGQITLGAANEIIHEIDKIDLFNDIIDCSEEHAMSKGLLIYVGTEIDKEYLDKVVKLSINPEASKNAKDFKVVYTPLHGTGLNLICTSLKMLGYSDVHVVESQKNPNGNFPTVKSPNPEEKESLKEAIRLGELINADIVFGTDPDADRVGVAVKNKKGSYELLTGNQIGALLIDYIVSNKKDITSKDVVVKTIVTSDLGANIAKSYGINVIETLTGFKYIGEKIKEFEESGEYNFLFGYEESYGYLLGTFVRDKDAIISSLLIVEMSAYYKSKGLTLLDVLDGIYNKYGYYSDSLDNFDFKGVDSQEKITKIVSLFNDIDYLAKEIDDIDYIDDYNSSLRSYCGVLVKKTLKLPKSNVRKVYLKDSSWFAVRPSGTESKLKIYYSSFSKSKIESLRRLEILKDSVQKIIKDNIQYL